MFYRLDKCEKTNTTSEQRKFMFYCKELLEPFVKFTRERIYGWELGTPIHDVLTSISWIYGASVQLNAIIS